MDGEKKRLMEKLSNTGFAKILGEKNGENKSMVKLMDTLEYKEVLILMV